LQAVQCTLTARRNFAQSERTTGNPDLTNAGSVRSIRLWRDDLGRRRGDRVPEVSITGAGQDILRQALRNAYESVAA